MAKKKAETEAAAEAEAGGEKINKTEAVRRALADGVDAPLEGVAYVKKQFDIDITPQMFSSYKSLARKKAGSGGRTKAGPTGGSSSIGSTNPADLARTIKALVEQHGANAVIEMARVFE
ncbi:MAG: hypothetical protein JWO38_6877 [Gemmataceae bacterium]|nr:hypothetical protein [Gemmataceae bacterium]